MSTADYDRDELKEMGFKEDTGANNGGETTATHFLRNPTGN